MSDKQTTPEVLWAQRSSATDPERNYIFLTISAPDVHPESFKVNLQPSSLTFTGHSETKKTTYHVQLDFFGIIDVNNSKTNHTSRDVEFVLRKKELGEEYWPRLLKDEKKVHFLKTDFDKWVDEDEQDAVPEDLAGAGGMPDMGAMGGMGGDGGFGGIDFSKLGGGAGGMPNLGDLPNEGEEGDEDEDEEMPGLEGDEEEAASKGKGKEVGEAAAEPASKIEEIP